jgi:hypothetical protein
MSVSFGCHCPERRKPVHERNWVVRVRNGNRSAFNGYRWQSSDYSLVECLSCGAMGRTKAKYVARLEDRPFSEDYPSNRLLHSKVHGKEKK